VVERTKAISKKIASCSIFWVAKDGAGEHDAPFPGVHKIHAQDQYQQQPACCQPNTGNTLKKLISSKKIR
jgi:hypothetical protein